jgi:OFA family oxalate/formate antiporter-like MFS transporter
MPSRLQERLFSSESIRGNRWAIAAAAAVVMTTTGTVYSWALFTQPLLVAFRWDVTATTWTYAIANFCLAAVGAVVGGFWQDRVGPRRVAMVGVVLWGLGNVLAGWGTPFWGAPWLYLCYGVIGGTGAGMAYIAPLSMVTKWFPDRRGLAGGLVAGGFGLGAFIYNQLVPRLAGFHAAALHASGYIAAQALAKTAGVPLDAATLTPQQILTPSDIAAVMQVFVGSGVGYLIIGLTAAALFRNPPPDHAPSGFSLGAQRRSAGLRPSQVVRTAQFYLLWLQLFANVVAGITLISNAIFILEDLTRLPVGRIAPLFGLVSSFNAVGRIGWGAVADRIGCRQSFVFMFAIQAVVLFWLRDVHELYLALGGFAVILLCCGGGFGTMPAYSAEYFGTRYMGLNYGLILSAWGVAGLAGPLLIAHAKDLSGSFAGTLPIAGSLLTLAIVLPFLTSRIRAAGSDSALPGAATVTASELG